MNHKTIYLLLLALLALPCLAGNKYESKITSLEGEKWWGGMVALGSKMPFEGDLRLFDLAAENLNNQNVPLLLSSEGRYVWSDKPCTRKRRAKGIKSIRSAQLLSHPPEGCSDQTYKV